MAELIKNAYDADATMVVLRFGEGEIEVIDNGDGMTFDEFQGFWLRVGSPHKQRAPISPRLGRAVTGSKGVGRLAVQFLARSIEVRTVSVHAEREELLAEVNWDDAVEAGDLTNAEALVTRRRPTGKFAGGARHGTALTLRRLEHAWTNEEIRGVAEEIWSLQPPFRPSRRNASDRAREFQVVLEGVDAETLRAFEAQMNAALRSWEARIVGRIRQSASKCVVEVTVEFAGAGKERTEIPLSPCRIHESEFEIRVFRLQYRQGKGIKVHEARDYFKEFGGVHIYDAGFHLPYYGPDTDWLGIERDHAARLSRSALLPESLQVERGLNYLPTQRRLFGIVNVNTGAEQAWAQKSGPAAARRALTIQVSRDRLVDNEALQSLATGVRSALDFYATRAALRGMSAAEARRSIEPLSEKTARVSDVLDRYAGDIGESIYAALRHEIDDVIQAAESEAEAVARRIGLLGPLATAGITALAYDHELGKQLSGLRRIASDLRTIAREYGSNSELLAVAESIDAWLQRAREMRALFAHFSDENNRTANVRLKARATLEAIVEQLRGLERGVKITVEGVDPELRLPPASFAEWASVFQNVLINAITATLDVRDRRIAAASKIEGRRRTVVIQDTGVGVDLERADRLFEPFERDMQLSRERRELGFGGTGLGLTIVKMVASNIGCRVGFVAPDRQEGFTTSFALTWQEKT